MDAIRFSGDMSKLHEESGDQRIGGNEVFNLGFSSNQDGGSVRRQRKGRKGYPKRAGYSIRGGRAGGSAGISSESFGDQGPL